MTNSIPPLTALVQYLRKSSWSFGVTTGSLAVKLILLIGPLMPLNWGFFRFAGHSRAFSREGVFFYCQSHKSGIHLTAKSYQNS